MFLDLSKCYLYIIYVRINNVLACEVENQNSGNRFDSSRGTGNNVDDDFYDYPKIIYLASLYYIMRYIIVGYCPVSYPHAFFKGEYCCAHYYGCSGGTLDYSHNCCKDGKYRKCPTGWCHSAGRTNFYMRRVIICVY